MMDNTITQAQPGFLHHFEPGTDAAGAPLLLLHGTGGDESDLLPLGQAIAPGRALLSPRGRVLENGIPRFFRRLAEGIFDEDDVIAQTHALAAFIDKARERHGLAAPVAVGFSNGANIAAALLLLHPDVLAGAVLIRAMPPLREPPQRADLTGKRVLMLSGRADPIVPASAAETLAATLGARGATVTHQVLAAGHGLTNQDVLAARAFLAA
jgi:phospholipase/carboxylesterase